MAVILSDLLKPALRRAGITKLPGTTPSTDQYAELVTEMNRMLGSWNCTQLNIYTRTIASHNLTTASSYTIGPSGVFNTVRPLHIEQATLIMPGGIRSAPLHVTTDATEWQGITQQALAGSNPLFLYNDRRSPLSTLYLWPQDSGANDLELITWTAVASAFTAVSDAVTLPDGYEDAIVNNFAIRVATLYPRDSALLPGVEKLARQTLARIQSMNAPVLTMTTDAPGASDGGHFDWLSGTIR